MDTAASDLKYCPHCKEWLSRTEFGICHARSDGQNLYCRKSIRTKVAEGRQRVREYKHAQANAGQVSREIKPAFAPRRIARILRKLQPDDRVREAIRAGAETQEQIARATRLTKDQVCEAIAQCLLWDRTITTEVISGTRCYFVKEQVATNSPMPGVKRKPLELSYSAVTAIMPGRRRAA